MQCTNHLSNDWGYDHPQEEYRFSACTGVFLLSMWSGKLKIEIGALLAANGNRAELKSF